MHVTIEISHNKPIYAFSVISHLMNTYIIIKKQYELHLRYAHSMAKLCTHSPMESSYYQSTCIQMAAKRRYTKKLSSVGLSLQDDPYLAQNNARFSGNLANWLKIEFGHIFTCFILRSGVYTQEQLLS